MTFQSERHRSGGRSLTILAASCMDRTSYMYYRTYPDGCAGLLKSVMSLSTNSTRCTMT